MKSKDPSDRLFVVLAASFLTTLLIADITAGKFFLIGDLEVSVGVIPFPVAFLITDIVNEYYGRRGARLLTLVGMAMLIFGFLLLVAMRLLPVAPHSPVPQAAFEKVFGTSYRFFGASLLAYLVSQVTDIYTFHWYKRLTNSRHLWLRATGSTAVSQIVDTGIVNFTALAGLLPFAEIARISAFSYLYKLAVAVVLTPACYAAHAVITNRMGIEPAGVEGDLPYAGP